MKMHFVRYFVILSLLVSTVFAGGDFATPQEKKDWEKWAKSELDKTQSMPKEQAIAELGNWVYKLNHQQQSTDTASVREEATALLLSIPGHAQYFADEIESERQTVQDLPPHVGDRISYDRHRYWYIEGTLEHLPSPETIQILGKLLYDERDTPPPPSRGQDWTDIPANSLVASEAIANIGLRHAPVPKGHEGGTVEALAKHKAWYEKVKAGTLAFSFEGQNVEYRFKPDGTVETTPLKSSDEASNKKMSDSHRHPPIAQQSMDGTESQPAHKKWHIMAWTAGALLAVCLSLVLLFRVRRSS
jgi:hypothetical protein